MLVTENQKLVLALADALERNASEIAAVNYKDTGTSVITNFENVKRGVSTLRRFVSKQIVVKSSTGIAIYSCYNDPSFGLLGMNLGPAILACGNKQPIILGFPNILAQYASLIREIITETKLFNNISYQMGTKAFFESAINSPNIRHCVVYGENWITKYINPWAQLGRSLVFYGPGNNAGVVMTETNLEQTVHKILESAFILSGQAAVCINRCYVSTRLNIEKIKRAFVEGLKNISYGFEPNCFVTPIEVKMLVDVIEKRISESVAGGAELVQFEIEENQNRILVKPAIVFESNPESALVTQYHFAPVLPICFVDEQSIAEHINNTNYGIYVSFWSDTDIPSTIIRAVEPTHIMVLKNQSILDVITPEEGYTGYWGGYKESGFYFNEKTGFKPTGGKTSLIEILNN